MVVVFTYDVWHGVCVIGGGGGGYGPIGGGPSLISSERMVGFGNSEVRI